MNYDYHQKIICSTYSFLCYFNDNTKIRVAVFQSQWKKIVPNHTLQYVHSINSHKIWKKKDFIDIYE